MMPPYMSVNLPRGMFTIYTNHSGGNLAHNHKTIKFDVVEELSASKYFQIS